MVGLVSEYDDLIFVSLLVIFAPIGFIVGVSAVLSNIGASIWINLLITTFNIGLVGYLLYHWQVIKVLRETFEGFLQTS